MPAVLTMLTVVDWAALAFLLLGWQSLAWIIEREGQKRPSTYRLMLRYRKEWMTQMVSREPRIFDAQVLASLQQSASFFSSACLIALGGGIALLGQAERASAVFADISENLEMPVVVWEVKLLLVLGLLAISLLKFIWSVRLFSYQAVVMSSVPNDVSDEAYATAARASQLNIYAARSFNRGLRSLYISITAMVWLLGAVPLILAACLTFGVILRREYFSMSRDALV